YCKTLRAGMFGGKKFEDVTFAYWWDGKNVRPWTQAGPDGVGIAPLLWCLGIPMQEIELAPDLRTKRIPGEFVVRAGAPVEKVIPQFQHILRGLRISVRVSL